MTKLEKIKAAVRAGKIVRENSATGLYKVKLFHFPDGTEQWLITFAPTNWCIGLTWTDEKTLNGKHFFLHGEEILDDPCDQSKSPTSGAESTALAANSTAG